MVADPQYETDRAHFLGQGGCRRDRGWHPRWPPLSDTAGTVLDARSSRSGSACVSHRAELPRIAFRTLVRAASRAAAAGPDRQASRAAARSGGLQDLWPGHGPRSSCAISTSRPMRRRISSAGGADPLCRRPFPRPVEAIAQGGAAVRALAACHLRRPADRAAAHRRDRRSGAGSPTAARARVLAHETAGRRPGHRQSNAPLPISRTCRSPSRRRCAAASRGHASATNWRRARSIRCART
ncbi:hypothetical protein ACU4GD_37700 [Cupriavidus basilensis]